MDGHHPDLVTFAVKLALDLDIVGFHPDQKTGQAGHVRDLVGQRLRQKFVNPVLGLGPQPRQQFAASVMAVQHPLDQIIGAQEIGLRAQVVQEIDGRGMAGGVAQGLPEIAFATLCQLE